MSEPAGARTVLVTGATSGIGRATVLRLRSAGFPVLALGRNESSLVALAEECGAKPLVADVQDIATILERIGGQDIDILVSNAGILSSRARFQEIDPVAIDAMIDVNLKAPMHLTRALLPGMVARRRGHLIYLGSSAGQAPYPAMAAYGASKAGLSLFCDSLRCDLLGTGIRVSEIVPGRVETALYRSTLGPEGAKATLYDGYRPIQPEQIADLIETVIRLPDFVDVARLEVFPTDQAAGGGTMVRFE